MCLLLMTSSRPMSLLSIDRSLVPLAPLQLKSTPETSPSPKPRERLTTKHMITEAETLFLSTARKETALRNLLLESKRSWSSQFRVRSSSLPLRPRVTHDRSQADTPRKTQSPTRRSLWSNSTNSSNSSSLTFTLTATSRSQHKTNPKNETCTSLRWVRVMCSAQSRVSISHHSCRQRTKTASLLHSIRAVQLQRKGNHQGCRRSRNLLQATISRLIELQECTSLWQSI